MAEMPHCNSEVLHAPGTCVYCDEFPERQAMRSASNTPFTPAEANGWGGNVAQPKAIGTQQDPDGPEYPRPESANLAPNVLGMKALVYGGCALIVLVCLGLAIWALWP
jgi:hypothetical protein